MNLVQKYGGDYLKDASDLTAIADYVTRSRKEGDQLILVVAALQEIAKPMTERMNEMGLGEEISKGKLDLLFSTAEPVSYTHLGWLYRYAKLVGPSCRGAVMIED